MENMQKEELESIRLIDTKTLREVLGCCHNTAVKIGTAAGARIQLGNMVRWRVKDINLYLESLKGEKL